MNEYGIRILRACGSWTTGLRSSNLAFNGSRFTEAKREPPVDLHYARQVQDVMRLTLPDGLTIESTPEDHKQAFANKALFEVKATRAAGSVTSYRTMMLAMPVFLPADYDASRGFYGKLDAKDQETIVLSRAPAVAEGDGAKKPGS